MRPSPFPFSSVDEYRNKVASILKAAGSKTEPTVTILNTEQGLVQGYPGEGKLQLEGAAGLGPPKLLLLMA